MTIELWEVKSEGFVSQFNFKIGSSISYCHPIFLICLKLAKKLDNLTINSTPDGKLLTFLSRGLLFLISSTFSKKENEPLLKKKIGNLTLDNIKLQTNLKARKSQRSA